MREREGAFWSRRSHGPRSEAEEAESARLRTLSLSHERMTRAVTKMTRMVRDLSERLTKSRRALALTVTIQMLAVHSQCWLFKFGCILGCLGHFVVHLQVF